VNDNIETMRVKWLPAPEYLTLGDQEVHVWRASLDRESSIIETMLTTLSPDEKGRAARFEFEPARMHFISARSVLRELLGAYAGLPPTELRFSYGSRGKPALVAKPEIRFNTAHSHGLAVYAFTRGRAVGIDVERIQPDFAGEDVASWSLSPRELNAWRALPPSAKTEEFFRFWTCKEAYTKARGLGLEISLGSFEVVLTGEAQGRILLGGVDAGWQVVTLLAAESHPAALVYQGEPCSVSFFSGTKMARVQDSFL
jgi:4'-phosphopantetheinyl transferase